MIEYDPNYILGVWQTLPYLGADARQTESMWSKYQAGELRLSDWRAKQLMGAHNLRMRQEGLARLREGVDVPQATDTAVSSAVAAFRTRTLRGSLSDRLSTGGLLDDPELMRSVLYPT